ncbi:hypothetical protein CWB96_03925 [Pseudoalteromonas citrea]|uniref:Uncharacterized protein n=1 Tax=Pseudoalteromonas citrea TaxID=43655 RepID=A0A5S3XSY5_9GAMM|nr:HEAT repeat domain-containing protein [Pseudoalteromonas citrea]TMP45178.1 hypothetical protein CWB97_05085 [Pseudoalteromonas citrea]TMP61441.1 hypothetical protein CWB96_03925 [Pseudoalteromonas citrea]
MKKNILITVALCLTLVLIFTWRTLQPNEQSNAVAVDEKTFVAAIKAKHYRVKVNNIAKVDSSALLSQLLGHSVDAKFKDVVLNNTFILTFNALSDEDNGRLFSAQLSNFSEALSEDVKWLMAPFLLMHKNNGELVLDTQYVEYSPEQENFLHLLLSSLQFVQSPQQLAKWETTEHDGIGAYKAHYSQLSRSTHSDLYQREKLHYYPQVERDLITGDLKPHITLSKDTFELDREGIVRSVVSSQRVNIRKQHKTVIDLTSNIEFTYLDKPVQSGNVVSLQQVKRYYLNHQLTSSAEIREIEFNDATSIVSWLIPALTENEDHALSQLVLLLQDKPYLAKDLIFYINQNLADLSDPVELRIWYAMAEAGGPQIQEAFVEALNTTEFDPLIAFRVITYSYDFKAPTERFFEQLLQYRSGLDINSDDGQELSSMTLYVVGALLDASQIEPVVKKRFITYLQSALKQSDDTDEITQLLIAIGNSAASEFIDDVEPYLIQSDQNVVSAAFDSLASMDNRDATALFLDRYSAISEQEVQASILSSLQNITPTESLNNWVNKKLRATESQQELTYLIPYAGIQAQENKASESALRAVLAKPLSFEQKRLIYQYIEPL